MLQLLKTLLVVVIAFAPLAATYWYFARTGPAIGVALGILSSLWVMVTFVMARSIEEARDDLIVQNGKQASARVISIQPTGASRTDSPEVRIELEVTPTDESPFRCTVTIYVDVVHIPQYQPERIVRVFYMPDKKRFVLEPRS